MDLVLKWFNESNIGVSLELAYDGLRWRFSSFLCRLRNCRDFLFNKFGDASPLNLDLLASIILSLSFSNISSIWWVNSSSCKKLILAGCLWIGLNRRFLWVCIHESPFKGDQPVILMLYFDAFEVSLPLFEKNLFAWLALWFEFFGRHKFWTLSHLFSPFFNWKLFYVNWLNTSIGRMNAIVIQHEVTDLDFPGLSWGAK